MTLQASKTDLIKKCPYSFHFPLKSAHDKNSKSSASSFTIKVKSYISYIEMILKHSKMNYFQIVSKPAEITEIS